MSLWLGIDTSNYTTSAALADENGIVCNCKLPLPVAEGARGLRQSDAVFAHVRNLPQVMEMVGKRTLTAVGYSATPRDAEDSYMPCFGAGEAVARSIAALNGLPIYRFSHQAGHIAAAIYSSGRDLWDSEFLAFHVSGGTTELLHVNHGVITCVGGTEDLNAGQAIDRIGVMLGLHFPCGAQLEALAGDTVSARPRVCVRDLTCNLSGLENRARRMLEEGKPHEEIAAYTLEFIEKTLDKLTENAIARFGKLPVLYAGGVMSNRRIRAALSRRFDASFAEPQFSCDNAAGIALLCRRCDRKEGGGESNGK